ncbi:MAG: hypothetical protein ACTSRG_25605 [Candidatus Helarchaeota archaeon]
MQIPEREDKLDELKIQFTEDLQILFESLRSEVNISNPDQLLSKVHTSAVRYFNAFERTLDEYTLPSTEITKEIKTRKAEDTLNMTDTILQYWGMIKRFCLKYDLNTLKPSATAYASIQRVLKHFYPDKILELKTKFLDVDLPITGFVTKGVHMGWNKSKTIKTQLIVGIPILTITLILSFIFTKLSGFQYFILRLFLALGITLVGSSLIEGKVKFNTTNIAGFSIKATGWIAIFLIIFFLNPPSPPNPEPVPNNNQNIKDSNNVQQVGSVGDGSSVQQTNNYYSNEKKDSMAERIPTTKNKSEWNAILQNDPEFIKSKRERTNLSLYRDSLKIVNEEKKDINESIEDFKEKSRK